MPVQVSVYAGDGRTLAYLATHFFEDERRVEGDWIICRGRASRAVLERLCAAGETVRILSGRPEESQNWAPPERARG